jgi:formate-dependent phosphoribosylglycinamide formyltransferase (GAR transformylase)
MQKVMVLGAGIYQVPLIKKVKEMGKYCIVVSIPGNYPGFQYADKVYCENIVNSEEILKIAKKENIDGICLTGTDVGVVTLGYVCSKLGLCGPSAKAGRTASNKLLMKNAFVQYGVNTANFQYVNVQEQNLKDICDKIGYPVIFKAIDSSGSRGIIKVESPDKIEEAKKIVLAVTKSDKYIIEEYLEGMEFGAQAFVQDGKIKFVLPHGDYVFKGNTGVPVGHYVPYDISENLNEAVKVETMKAIQSIGLDNCAINADFMLCNDKVYVLEIGARAGATCLVELVSIFYGYDYYEKIIRASLGEKVDFSPVNEKRVPNASKLILAEKSGIIINMINENEKSPDVFDVSFDYKIGDHVNKFRIGPDRIGQVIVKRESLDACFDLLNEVMEKVHVEVKEDDSK